MIKISTSILVSKNRINSIKTLNDTDTDYIHIDVMDGIFVPNYQLPLNEVTTLSKYSKKQFDIHLMMENPEPFIKNIKIDNIKTITVHLEINKNLDKLISLIKSYGYEVGLAIKPGTNLNLIDNYLDKIDVIIIMSVEPGFGGQKFIDNTVDKIKIIRNKKQDIYIEVDGGINKETIDKIKYIADIAVVGSYITNSNNYQEAINNLKN